MILKELINNLEELYKEEMKHYKVMGEPEIVIDVFEKLDGSNSFIYKGFSKDIEIQMSGDGVYPILTAKQTWN